MVILLSPIGAPTVPNLAKHWVIVRNVVTGSVFTARVYRSLPVSEPYEHIGHFRTEKEASAFLGMREGYYATHPDAVRRLEPIAAVAEFVW